jgi:exopolyphosphatase/guanosine-5'-triphosphate,3'-diphosphate pyrophosphatase
MREDRKEIIAGGVSVIRAVFKLLKIRQMQTASGGLRHGLICDLLGTSNTCSDLRNRSVQRLVAKFNVDQIHAWRVSKVACALFAQVRQENSGPLNDHEDLVQALEWAAQLHEMGSHISHSDYHKHGAYILDNVDAIGFTQPEMHRLSLLVLGQRGKLRKLEPALTDDGLVLQLISLRLALILCHARRDPDLDGITFGRAAAAANSLTLSCRAGWDSTYPQSAHLLREEAIAWQKTPWTFQFQGG